ncbi:MAG: UDP-N-acetylmuramate-L-alanine ligase [Parcubacteria group bacterium GW2011_GWF2_50_9]|nr:MAG: UDP-N-acetylmuramate-L-alanine ligase [Parcubacteria group bacterium GW2011_GWF2_50_9]
MEMLNFKKISSIHFIGIGGIGISAIARMFLRQAQNKFSLVEVRGSDEAESDVTEELRKLGARVFIGQKARNVPAECDLVIYTIAVTPDNPEFAEAKRRGIHMMSYPEALGEIARGKFTIAVSGTHGKTTTTAMIAKIMIEAGLDPTVVIGSFLTRSDLVQQGRTLLYRGKGRTNFIAGEGRYLVAEACEYRRSFLHLSPKILVITNIDADHLDYYNDLDDIESGFRELAAKVPEDGAVICDFSDTRAKRVASTGKGRVIDFGKFLTKVPKLLVPGVHNKKDAAAALAVAELLGVGLASAGKSLAGFSGAARRFEFRGRANNGALVYDDYGHHPTEIEAILQGARELFPLNKGGAVVPEGGVVSSRKGGASGGLSPKIVVVFQPHLYSRTKQHLHGFITVLKEANSVIVLPIYPAREEDPGDISSQMLADGVRKSGGDAHMAATLAEAAKLALKFSSRGDIIITLGAGETSKVADILVKNN